MRFRVLIWYSALTARLTAASGCVQALLARASVSGTFEAGAGSCARAASKSCVARITAAAAARLSNCRVALRWLMSADSKRARLLPARAESVWSDIGECRPGTQRHTCVTADV